MNLADTDSAMNLALYAGWETGPRPTLPPSLQGTTLREANVKRAAFLQAVENAVDTVVQPFNRLAYQQVLSGGVQTIDELNALLQEFAPQVTAAATANYSFDTITVRHLTDVPALSDRISISFRLWAGYMDAAKSIAEGTRVGPNDRSNRLALYGVVLAKAAIDSVYEAGVEAAPHYKHRVLTQPIFREGIPDGAIVLRDWDD